MPPIVSWSHPPPLNECHEDVAVSSGDDVAADSFSIAFGDFRKGYKIRDRAGVTVQRLVEKYADYDQTGFIVKKRVGGQVVLPEAFVLLKTSVA